MDMTEKQKRIVNALRAAVGDINTILRDLDRLVIEEDAVFDDSILRNLVQAKEQLIHEANLKDDF